MEDKKKPPPVDMEIRKKPGSNMVFVRAIEGNPEPLFSERLSQRYVKVACDDGQTYRVYVSNVSTDWKKAKGRWREETPEDKSAPVNSLTEKTKGAEDAKGKDAAKSHAQENQTGRKTWINYVRWFGYQIGVMQKEWYDLIENVNNYRKVLGSRDVDETGKETEKRGELE